MPRSSPVSVRNEGLCGTGAVDPARRSIRATRWRIASSVQRRTSPITYYGVRAPWLLRRRRNREALPPSDVAGRRRLLASKARMQASPRRRQHGMLPRLPLANIRQARRQRAATVGVRKSAQWVQIYVGTLQNVQFRIQGYTRKCRTTTFE
jgi:hypothetical protein